MSILKFVSKKKAILEGDFNRKFVYGYLWSVNWELGEKMHLSHFAPSKIPRFAAKKNITQKTRFHTQKHQKIVNVQNGISMREKSNCLYYNGEFLKVIFDLIF